MPELVAIARLLRTRGLKGELVAEILTDFPERFEGLRRVVGTGPDGLRKEFLILDHWFQKDRVILRFESIDTIEKAGDLVGFEICVRESDAVKLTEDEFFDWQLEGCEVATVDNSRLGKVTEVMRTGAGEILVVSGGIKEYLIPFVERICVAVDIDKKLIRVDAPEGLLDF